MNVEGEEDSTYSSLLSAPSIQYSTPPPASRTTPSPPGRSTSGPTDSTEESTKRDSCELHVRDSALQGRFTVNCEWANPTAPKADNGRLDAEPHAFGVTGFHSIHRSTSRTVYSFSLRPNGIGFEYQKLSTIPCHHSNDLNE